MVKWSNVRGQKVSRSKVKQERYLVWGANVHGKKRAHAPRYNANVHSGAICRGR